jgi:hypothetical protein
MMRARMRINNEMTNHTGERRVMKVTSKLVMIINIKKKVITRKEIMKKMSMTITVVMSTRNKMKVEGDLKMMSHMK